MVHPFSNVITGLIQAGGVDIKGSLRDIKIIRNNKIIGAIDLYDYLIKGISVNDIRLMDQDIIYALQENQQYQLMEESEGLVIMKYLKKKI